MPQIVERTYAPPYHYGMADIEHPLDPENPDAGTAKFKRLKIVIADPRLPIQETVQIMFAEEVCEAVGSHFLGLEQKIEIAKTIPDEVGPPPGEGQ